jgi:hypothetical protein
MRTIIAVCTMIVSLGLAGLAASSHGDGVPNAREPGVPVAAGNSLTGLRHLPAFAPVRLDLDARRGLSFSRILTSRIFSSDGPSTSMLKRAAMNVSVRAVRLFSRMETSSLRSA